MKRRSSSGLDTSTRSPAAPLREQRTTSQPSAASASEIARPMPRLAPVTIATCPASPLIKERSLRAQPLRRALPPEPLPLATAAVRIPVGAGRPLEMCTHSLLGARAVAARDRVRHAPVLTERLDDLIARQMAPRPARDEELVNVADDGS